MQLDPAKYTSFIGTMKEVAAKEGSGALLTGIIPTFQGYFVQGFFKFGGVEICKTQFAKKLCANEKDAWEKRDLITLGGSACAEFVADLFLCPYEAVRIRAVSDPTYASGMMATGSKMVSEMGVVPAFYSGFGPMLFKQKWCVGGVAGFRCGGRCCCSNHLSTSRRPSLKGEQERCGR